MSGTARVVQQGARAVAVLAALIALGGVVALVVVGLYAAEQSGIAIPFSVPITDGQAERFMVAGAVGLLGGVVLNLVFRTIGDFAAGFRSGQAIASGGGADGDAPSTPVSERYRRKLARTYVWIAGFVALLVVVGSIGEFAGSASVIDIALAIATIALDLLFGGVAGGVAVVAILLGLWYGVDQHATEALVAGFAVAVLFLLTAIALRAVGWIIFSLVLLYYNFLARGATEFQWVRADNVPRSVREFVR